MELSASACALYAQVVPVFVIALVAELAVWGPSPLAKSEIAVMWPFSAGIALGGVSAWVALTGGANGARGVEAFVILSGANACIGLAIVVGAVRPFSPWFYARAVRKREAGPRAARNDRRRKKPREDEG